MSSLGLVLACLKAMEIEELTVTLDGSGDSGDADFECALTRSGQVLYELPFITVAVDAGGHRTSLQELASGVAAELPEGDWVNNEGGYGQVHFRPYEDDPDLWVDTDMTYRDGYEDGDDADFDDELEEEDTVAEPEFREAALPIIIESVGGP